MESEQGEEITGNEDNSEQIFQTLEEPDSETAEMEEEIAEIVGNVGNSDLRPTNSEPEVLAGQGQEGAGAETIVDIGRSVENAEIIEETVVESPESEEPEPMEESEVIEEDVENDDEENEHSTTTSLQQGRIKKIMKICLQTNEKEPEELGDSTGSKENTKKGGGKGKGGKKSISGSTNNMLLSKEAIYLTTMATELFVQAVTQQSSRITTSTKKKTMTIEHLKRAVSDNESYEFLQGCLNPSIFIGE